MESRKSLTRQDAIKILERGTDGPGWDLVVEEWYDEEADTMPSLYDVFLALGVSVAEIAEATKNTEDSVRSCLAFAGGGDTNGT